MPQIDHIGQAGAQEIILLFSARMRLHHSSGIRKVSSLSIRNLAIPRYRLGTITQQMQVVPTYSGRT
ncbi:hypothetical protein, partial [Paracoccus beibuensis]|uniref:hypothetical protein n=1 Tax=Paracoccus beibuensis TaxID=547602 RepID=UPI00223EE334